MNFIQWVWSIFGWGVLVVAIIVCLLMQLIKKPYKKLTAKITVEKWRKLANKAIIVFDGLLALAIYWALSYWPWLVTINFLGWNFVASYGIWACAVAAGATSVVLYTICDGVLVSGPGVTDFQKILKDALSDGSLTWEEIVAIAKALGKVIDEDPTNAVATTDPAKEQEKKK